MGIAPFDSKALKTHHYDRQVFSVTIMIGGSLMDSADSGYFQTWKGWEDLRQCALKCLLRSIFLLQPRNLRSSTRSE